MVLMKILRVKPKILIWVNQESKETPVVFVKKLAELKAKTSQKDATQLLIGMNTVRGFITLSYYGQAWILTQRGKSTADLEYQ